ncbi:MAG: LamG-like jellyroll fold domain-containing protein [Desulfomicrobium sp.]|nr:LamG-like jellyroll fold domain-containing protein [Desulfomicrobium sp.]
MPIYGHNNGKWHAAIIWAKHDDIWWKSCDDTDGQVIVGAPYNIQFLWDSIQNKVKTTWDFDGTNPDKFYIFRDDDPLDPGNMPSPIGNVDGDKREFFDDDIGLDDEVYYRVGYYEGPSLVLSVEALWEHKDPHWNNVVALLHFNGDFTDKKDNIWSAYGNVIASASGGIFGGHYIGDGKDGWIETTDANLVLGTENFTIEFFCNMIGSTYKVGFVSTLFDMRTAEPSKQICIEALEYNNPKISMTYNGNTRIQSSVNIRNTYRHVALVRNDSSIKMYIDGVSQGEWITPDSFSGNRVVIGGRFAPKDNDMRSLNGYIDKLRITKGVARYTSDYTPPDKPFPNK